MLPPHSPLYVRWMRSSVSWLVLKKGCRRWTAPRVLFQVCCPWRALRVPGLISYDSYGLAWHFIGCGATTKLKSQRSECNPSEETGSRKLQKSAGGDDDCFG